MKYEKLLNDVFKQVTANAIKGKSKQKICFGEYQDKIGICIDGFVLYLVPKDLCLIDTSKHRTNMDIEKFFKDIPDDNCSVTNTFEMINKNGKQIQVQKFINSDLEIESWVNTDLLKYLDSFSVKFQRSLGPVFLYEGEELVGMVMPINR